MKALRFASSIFLLSLLAYIVTGCATGTRFSPLAPRNDEALVYIYRPKQYQLLAGLYENSSAHIITINGHLRFRLWNGGYSAFFLPEGTNTFGSRPEDPYSWPDALGYTRKELLSTNFQAGMTYFLRFRLGFGPQLKIMESAAGEAEIKKCLLSE